MSGLSQIYSLPEYYDIAFGRDLSGEIAFFRDCFAHHGSVPVLHILEPAAGSGMFLAALPAYGYQVTGYDLSPESIQYARDRLARSPYRDMVTIVEGDMRDLTFSPPLDAAINTNNTISYCLSDSDILRHFRAMSASLRPGAVYVVEISCAHETPESENAVGDTWTMERDGIRVTGTWRVAAYDRERKIRHIDSRFEVEEGGRAVALAEKHQLRLWYAGDMRRLATEGGFIVAAIYDSEYRRLPGGAETHGEIPGEIGNLYFVLANRPVNRSAA